jgi:hypothetical protein
LRKPDPEAVARELDGLAEQQTGPERGELSELAAEIRIRAKHLSTLFTIAKTRMAEIREATGAIAIGSSR